MNHTKTFQLHRNVSIRLDKHYEKYKKRYPKRKHTISSYVNELIDRGLDRETVLYKYTPAYSVVGYVDRILHIRDRESHKVFSITREDNKLLCFEDNSHNCSHVMFAIVTDEVARLFDDEDVEAVEIPVKEV